MGVDIGLYPIKTRKLSNAFYFDMPSGGSSSRGLRVQSCDDLSINPGDTPSKIQVQLSGATLGNSAISTYIEGASLHIRHQMQATMSMMEVYNQLGKARKAKVSLATQMFVMECVLLRGVLTELTTHATILLHNGALIKVPFVNKYDSSLRQLTQNDVGFLLSLEMNGKYIEDGNASDGTAYGCVCGKYTNNNGENVDLQNISPLALMWLGLLLYEDDEKEQEEDAQAESRIRGFANLGDNYEGKRQYCLTMQRIMDAKIQSVTGPDVISGTVVTVSSGTITIKNDDAAEPVNLSIDDNAAKYLGIISGTRLAYKNILQRCVPIAVTGSSITSYLARYMQEKNMWKALGGDDNNAWTPQLPDKDNKGDVTRQFVSREFQERLQQYSALGDDFLGKMEFASRMIAHIPLTDPLDSNNPSLRTELAVWQALQADAAIAMKQKKKLVNAQTRQRE